MRRILVLLMLFAGVALAASTETAASNSPLTACVERYSHPPIRLKDGQKLVSSGEARVAGGTGIALSTPGAARDGSGSVEVVAPNDSDASAMAKQYAASGRSVLADAQAARLGKAMIRKLCTQSHSSGDLRLAAAGDGSIYDSFCAQDDSSQVRWEVV
jgi:hypothetical protein